MSVIIKKDDYLNENRKYKRSQRVAPKVRIPKQHKTKPCLICGKAATNIIKITGQTFHLCLIHWKGYVAQNESHPVIFVKASGLLD